MSDNTRAPQPADYSFLLYLFLPPALGGLAAAMQSNGSVPMILAGVAGGLVLGAIVYMAIAASDRTPSQLSPAPSTDSTPPPTPAPTAALDPLLRLLLLIALPLLITFLSLSLYDRHQVQVEKAKLEQKLKQLEERRPQ